MASSSARAPNAIVASAGALSGEGERGWQSGGGGRGRSDGPEAVALVARVPFGARRVEFGLLDLFAGEDDDGV